MEARVAKLPEPQRKDVQVARPMKTIVRQQQSPLKFEPIDTQQRQKIAKNGPDVSKFREQRAKWEVPATPPSAAPPAVERKEPAAQPPESTRAAPPPGEARAQKGAGPHPPAIIPPREVPATRPERVNVPTPPIVAKPNAATGKPQKTPQSPAGERKRQAEQSKGNPKDKKKEKGNE
jgi:hypothetical protein